MTPTPTIRSASDVDHETVDAADGLAKGVLIDESDGAPNFALRRFTLEPGATVPRHTNEVEHVQYVLEGEYVVGMGEDGQPEANADEQREGSAAGDAVTPGEHDVAAGDALFVPSGAVHWYRNEGDDPAAFLCAVPHGEDDIQLVE